MTHKIKKSFLDAKIVLIDSFISIWDIDKSYYVLFLIKLFLDSALPLFIVIFPKIIIDNLTKRAPLKIIVMNISLLIIVQIISGIINSSLNYFMSFKKNNIKRQIDLYLSKKMLSVKFIYLESPETLELKDRAQQYINRFGATSIITEVSTFISSIITLVGLTAIIFSLGSWLIPLIFIVVMINSVAKAKEANKSYFYRKQFSEIAKKLFYIIYTTWDIKYAKEIRIYQLKKWLSDKKQKFLADTSKKSIRIFMIGTMIDILSNSLGAIKEMIIYLYLTYRAINRTITIGDFSMYINAVANFSGCLSRIASSYNTFIEASKYAKDYTTFLNLDEHNKLISLQQNEYMLKDSIEIKFNNVYFKYPGNKNYALKDVSFIISLGEKVALVGDNGAGKSTIVNLLLRLYEPERGTITFNNIDIHQIPIEDYTRMISVVFQNYKTFAFTLKDNITYGVDDDDKMKEAISSVGLSHKIEKLPSGYDTYLTRQFVEEGTEFSGGEQQKVAIANILFKNAMFAILDEPTANLSPMAEYDMYQNFTKMFGKKGILLVSHRMPMCKLCDKIIVLENGEVREQGTHNELMTKKGLYFEAFSLQASQYAIY